MALEWLFHLIQLKVHDTQSQSVVTMKMKTLITYIISLHETKNGLIPLQMDRLVGRRIVHANQTQMKNEKTSRIGYMRSLHNDALGLESLHTLYQLRCVKYLIRMGLSTILKETCQRSTCSRL